LLFKSSLGFKGIAIGKNENPVPGSTPFREKNTHLRGPENDKILKRQDAGGPTVRVFHLTFHPLPPEGTGNKEKMLVVLTLAVRKVRNERLADLSFQLIEKLKGKNILITQALPWAT